MNLQTANHATVLASPSSRREPHARPGKPAGAVTAAVLAALLAACGGGGGGGGDSGNQHAAAASTPPAPPSVPQSTLTGLLAPTSSPATVTVQLVDSTQSGKTVTLTATPDANGAFTLSAPTSAIPKSSQVAVIVSAPGYLPTTIVYTTDASGTATPVSATNTLGTQAVSGPIALVVAAQGTFSFAGLDLLYRLGDGNTNDMANSKLQLPAPPNASPVVMKASQRIPYADPGKTQLMVSLLVRGLEVSTCPGAKATLRSFNSANAEFATEVKSLVDSPASGDFGPQSLTFAIDSTGLTGGALQLEIQTGQCTIVNHDDMEFVGTTGTLS